MVARVRHLEAQGRQFHWSPAPDGHDRCVKIQYLYDHHLKPPMFAGLSEWSSLHQTTMWTSLTFCWESTYMLWYLLLYPLPQMLLRHL